MTIAELRPYVRFLIGDHDPDIPLIDSTQIDNAVKLVVMRQDITDADGTTLKIVSGQVSPDITAEDDPQAYSLIIYKVAKMFAQQFTRYSYRSRAFSESFGDKPDLVMSLLEEVYNMEFPSMMA
jgi:hypothetical protein